MTRLVMLAHDDGRPLAVHDFCHERYRHASHLASRPAGLASPNSAGGPGQVLFGGQGALGIPPMPTWAMILVIAGWSAIGAWRMSTRDA